MLSCSELHTSIRHRVEMGCTGEGEMMGLVRSPSGTKKREKSEYDRARKRRTYAARRGALGVAVWHRPPYVASGDEHGPANHLSHVVFVNCVGRGICLLSYHSSNSPLSLCVRVQGILMASGRRQIT